MKSFILSKKDVKLFLDYLKIYSFKDNSRIFLQSISLWQIDGVNYICATDGRSAFMMDAPNLGIKISKELSASKCFRMSNVKGNQDMLFEVTEDNISVFIGDSELEPINGATFPSIDRILPNVSKFYKINEIVLGNLPQSEYFALLNGVKKDGINIKYLNFMYKNFKNIEFGPSGEDGSGRPYEFKNDLFRMICVPVDLYNSELLTLGEFNNQAKQSQRLVPELENLVVNTESINEDSIYSFVVPNRYVVNILKFFKKINNKNLKPDNKGIRFFYRDGSIYLMCTDGRDSIFIEVEKQYNGHISDSIQDTLFNVSDISTKSDLEVLVYESAISVNSGGKNVSYITKKTDFDFGLLNKNLQKKDVNEIFLKYEDDRSKNLFVQINESFYVHAKIFDFFCEEGIIPKTSDVIEGKYDHVILSSSDVFVCAASSVRSPGKYIDVEYYYNNVNTQRLHLSEYLLSLIKFPDITKQYSVDSFVRGADWIVPYNDKILAIVDSVYKVIQPIDVPRFSYTYYKLSNNNTYGNIDLIFDVNLNLEIFNPKNVLRYKTEPNSIGPRYGDLDRHTKNSLGKFFVYKRGDKRGGQSFYFELDGMLYPLWKLLLLESGKDLKYGFYKEQFGNEYLVVTDGNLFILFDEDVPLAYTDKQVSSDIIDKRIIPYPSSLDREFKDGDVNKFFEKMIKTPEREDIVEEGMVFSNRFSSEEIINWNDEYQYALEVTEQIGEDLVHEFTQSAEIKKIIDAIDLNISNILRDYANKIDKSIDSKGLDFVANKIISKIGFKGDKKDLLIIMQGCGIDEAYILKVVHESIKDILSKNYGDF